MIVHFLPDGADVEIAPDKTVLQAAIEGHIPLSHICGGQTRCTTCRVRVLEGIENCNPRTDQEQLVADQSHFPENVRLGCQTTVNGDVSLRRLVVDEGDLVLTTQSVVERVRSEVLVMERTEDIARIVAVLWEGIHDVGLHIDYCAVEIRQNDRVETIAVAGNWLERRHGVTSSRQKVNAGANAYRSQLDGVTESLSPEESFRQTWRIESEEAYTSGTWWSVPLSHGRFVVMCRRGCAFEGSDERILETFADSVSLAYARVADFQKLETTNTELQETLSELKRTQAELVQSAKMASLGQLVAGVAHEINTPLGAIQSNNDTLTRSVERIRENLSEDDAKLTRVVDVIDTLTQVNRTAIERIDTVVTNLRRFARLDEASLANYDIREGLDHTIALVSQEFTGRIAINTEFKEIPLIQCYPALINQAFMSVILNACQAIEGSGTVTISTRATDDSVAIEITDTGEGIAAENLDKIFDPGYTTRGGGVGTGLGLSIVHQIIEKHLGSIDVSSSAGIGTTVQISLPTRAPS